MLPALSHRSHPHLLLPLRRRQVTVRTQARTIGLRAIRWAAAERQHEEQLGRQRKAQLAALLRQQRQHGDPGRCLTLGEAGREIAAALSAPEVKGAPPCCCCFGCANGVVGRASGPPHSRLGTESPPLRGRGGAGSGQLIQSLCLEQRNISGQATALTQIQPGRVCSSACKFATAHSDQTIGTLGYPRQHSVRYQLPCTLTALLRPAACSRPGRHAHAAARGGQGRPLAGQAPPHPRQRRWLPRQGGTLPRQGKGGLPRGPWKVPSGDWEELSGHAAAGGGRPSLACKRAAAAAWGAWVV